MTAALDLEWIDRWEVLRAAVLENVPDAAGLLAERLARDWRRTPPQERATLAVAAALDLQLETPAHRRHARALLNALDVEFLSVESPESYAVREAPPIVYSDIPIGHREALAKDVAFARSAEFQRELDAASGPAAATRRVSAVGGRLKAERAARFLALLGFPLVVPDRARRRWLDRLGVPSVAADNLKGRAAALETFAEIARRTGSDPREINVITALFTGAEGPADFALCGARPDCPRCPLQRACRYGTSPEATPQEEPERLTLAEAYLPEDRPRERLAKHGAETLTTAELLAILLRTGTKKEHAVALSTRLLRRAGSLQRLATMNLTELAALEGLGPVKAATIKAGLELARRIATAPQDLQSTTMITGPRVVFDLLRGYFLERKKEVFVGLLCDTKNRVTRQVIISEGTLNASLVHPREAFMDALRDGASGVVFVHNHPSGDPAPSKADFEITHRLYLTSEVVGIRLLDHVIVGRDSYFSFADAGKLKP